MQQALESVLADLVLGPVPSRESLAALCEKYAVGADDSAALSESLERLHTEYIDLYLLHRDDESVEVGPLIEMLNQEQARGRIRAFGASNWQVRFGRRFRRPEAD